MARAGGGAPQVRRAAIEQLVGYENEVSIPSLAQRFAVSEMTIRRDLDVLEADGVLHRLVGGRAALAVPKRREPALSTRADVGYEVKVRIGQAAADLIRPEEVVFFDGGSTALAVARALKGAGKPLTVLTRSLWVANELGGEPDVEVFVLGGRLKASEMVTSSSTRADDLQDYNVDTYVMGISGVHAVRGLTDYDPEESASKRSALGRSDRVLLVFDRSKVGRVLLSRVADLDDADVVVTDVDKSEELFASFAGKVRTVAIENGGRPETGT